MRSLLASSANEIVAAARNPHTSKKRLCGPPACASNSTAKCPNGEISQAFQYVYDRFGNRWQQTATSGGGPQPQYTFDNGNNHVDGWSYDAEGNLLNDTIHSYTYDAENRIISVDGGATTYVYDAEGRRARKTVGGVAWDYLYDLAGHQLAEVGTGGAWDRQEVYAGGRHLATYVPAATNFHNADWLGTERVWTNLAGQIAGTCQSLPFGDGQVCSASDPSPMHFTGKQRDTESNLDNFDARYYSSMMGRFMTPDWSASPEAVPYVNLHNPQTLNLYAYVGNNPTSGVDPGGHRSGESGCEGTTGGSLSCNDLGIGSDNNDGVGGGQDQKVQPPTAQNNQQTREDIAKTAEKYKDSTDWAYDKKKGAFGCNTWKCNQFVGDVVKEAGAPAEVNGRYPTAGEWADKKTKIDNWRVLGADEKPQAGDVAAYKIPGCHGCTGHSGIVVGVDSQGVHAMAAHYDVVGPDNKFQPSNSAVVFRRYTGDEQ